MKLLFLLLAWPLSPDPGQQLAQHMRQTQLLRAEPFRGTLQTKKRRGRRISQTLLLRARAEGEPTHSEFIVSSPNGNLSCLTILRDGRQTCLYFLSDNPRQLGKPLLPPEAMSSFAGSDFWPTDLGLEFFHWPQQKILPHIRIKMRKGVACRVLESRRQPAADFGYSRVRSWISREHLGLIYAEAYNHHGQRVKTFEVSGLQKIDGQWKVSELRIRNEVAQSTTKLILRHREPY